MVNSWESKIVRETQFTAAPHQCDRGMMYGFLSLESYSPLLLLLSFRFCSPSNRSPPIVGRQEKVEGYANMRRKCASRRELREWVGKTRREAERTFRVAVHLSLISHGMRRPPTPLLSTAKPSGYRAGGWERGGYTRNARVLAKHDLFYRSSRAASIIPGRSTGSYLPPVRQARHGVWTGDQQVQDSAREPAGCRDRAASIETTSC